MTMQENAEMPATSPATMPQIGPYSRPPALARLDQRTREAKLLREATADLTAHVGGKPSAVQRRLIERAAMLALRLALMDAKEPHGGLSERDAREYLCWNNAYVRTLAALGGPTATLAPSGPGALASHLAARVASR
jgi:hypothetical protein